MAETRIKKMRRATALVICLLLAIIAYLVVQLMSVSAAYQALDTERGSIWTMFSSLQQDYLEEVEKNMTLTDEHAELRTQYAALYDKVDELASANLTLSDRHITTLSELEHAHEQILGGKYTVLPFSREDIEAAIATVIAEAGGEPYEGQQAVAQCIRDRYYDGSFGKTIKEICLAKDQFAPPYEGSISDYPSCYRAVIEVFYWDVDVFDEPVLYFYNPNHSEPEMVTWLETRTYLGQICCHIFRGGPYV